MTSTGSRLVGRPKPWIYPRLLRRRAAADRSAAISAAVEIFRFIGSRGFAFDEEHLRELAGRSWDRGYNPAGYLRQLAAIAAQPNRTAELGRIAVPTLVIHGLHDPLVAPNTSSRIGSSERFYAVGYPQGCPLVIHSNPRAGWSRPAAGPGLGPAPN
jgi:pimeloyl-ACP methyl ester carboxylesterase